MLDYSKIFVKENNNDALEERHLVLYTMVDSTPTILNSENAKVKSCLTNEILKTLDFKNNSFIEKEQFIFALISSDASLNMKHRIWLGMAKIYDKLIDKNISVVIDGEYTEECVYGLVIKSYSYDFIKKDPKNNDKKQLKLKFTNSYKSKALEIANIQNFARFLGDTPANLMTPLIMSEYIKSLFSSEKIDLKILDKKMIEAEQMNLILSVSQGSSQEPVFIHAKYFGRDSCDIDLALVGKGVTFDTGGISLKPAEAMYKLKQDMMGAAICASLMKIVSSLNLKINLSITLPLVENMPGSSATKPGDVFISKCGKSVEVDNTDAEGRLILADAITFAQKDNPEFLFDIATLTGSVRIALGNVYGGYFTGNEDLSSLIELCSTETGDLLWRLPLSPFIAQELSSDVADLSNAAKINKGAAGASYAAEFIKEFVDPHVKWAHFDVSGIRNNHHFKELFGDQTTARPIPTFFALIEKLERKFK